MTPEQAQYLDEVEARAKAATPGPWFASHLYEDEEMNPAGPCTLFAADGDLLCLDDPVCRGLAEEDAALIAHSRTDVEHLTALVRAYAGAWDEFGNYLQPYPVVLNRGDFQTRERHKEDLLSGMMDVAEKYGLDKLP